MHLSVFCLFLFALTFSVSDEKTQLQSTLMYVCVCAYASACQGVYMSTLMHLSQDMLSHVTFHLNIISLIMP